LASSSRRTASRKSRACDSVSLTSTMARLRRVQADQRAKASVTTVDFAWPRGAA